MEIITYSPSFNSLKKNLLSSTVIQIPDPVKCQGGQWGSRRAESGPDAISPGLGALDRIVLLY